LISGSSLSRMATEVCSRDRARGLGTTSSFETLPDTQPMHDFAEIVQGYKGDNATCLVRHAGTVVQALTPALLRVENDSQHAMFVVSTKFRRIASND
jgi:hypothetical protein